MRISRRSFVGSALALGMASTVNRVAWAAPPQYPLAMLPMEVAAHSPWMSNAVAVTSDNVVFLGLPRWPGHEITPSVARMASDGTAWPFPGGDWNNWKPGVDPTNAFVYVNSVHIFADDTVWCVDQGALRADVAPPGAQKLVQLDPRSGKILQIIRFADDIVPPGSKINDLRFHGSLIYITDSGLGGIIVHDLATGKTIRRLSGYPQMQANPEAPPKPGAPVSHHKTPKSDLIEVSADGAWLYWASPTGPFRRVQTKYLLDQSLPDATLAQHVELYFDMTLTGGSAMDTLGNLYLTDIPGQRVILRSPGGKEAVLGYHPDLISGDAPFLTADHKLYIPAPQTQWTALFGGPDHTKRPYLTFVMQLPKEFAGIPIGDPITG